MSVKLNRRIIFCLLVLSGLLFFNLAVAQSEPLWLRYPAISPDGKTIAFGYKGDIYLVPSAGGTAIPLTVHEAHDMMPVWSRDGKSIAFASDRHGNFDVFILPVSGGAPQRLTYHSSPDLPYDFTPDNKSVLFESARHAPASSVRFYQPRLFTNLYTVSVKGGRAVLVSADGAKNGHYNSKGTQLVFSDQKTYEEPSRKHQTSSATKDVILYDFEKKQHLNLTTENIEDLEPVFSANDQFIYYLSEKNGNQNIFKKPLLAKIAEQQLTNFKTNPVRHLSVSSSDLLCFTYDGEIYTLAEGGKPEKVKIQIINDGRSNVEKNVAVNGDVSEFKLSPNGKEIAFVTRGEVFVTSTGGTVTKRITNTPQQERMIEWAPDGRTLYFSAERNNSWDILKVSIAAASEPYFYASTLLKEETLIASDKEEFQPKVSPDGKEIAYLENRNKLQVYNLATKKIRTILPEGRKYSYQDGDQYYIWSPDSKWLLVEDNQGVMFSFGNAALIKADGSATIYPVNSGFGEFGASFGMDGKMLLWANSRQGKRGYSINTSGDLDIYGLFFDQAAYDKFMLNKDDYALLQEQEEKDKKEAAKDKKDTLKKEEWLPDFEKLDSRKIRLTINSSRISDYKLSPDGSKLYYLASFEKGYDLWVTEPRTRETKILAKLGGSPSGMELSKDGKTIYVTNRGSLVKIDETGKISPVGINSEMVVNASAERAYIFDHAWRQIKHKFYDPARHGVDWNAYRNVYARFLPHVSNNYDFQDVLSELMGELNASHTGAYYDPEFPMADQTAALGIIPDERFSGVGIKVDEIITGGPLDKAQLKIKAGDIIERIDDQEISDDVDWNRFLNQKVNKLTQLSVYNPSTKTRWTETVKPVSLADERPLMYKRWIKLMTDMVDKLSDGKVGYIHVPSMNDESFREVLDKTMGKNIFKEALIVDTRFNGGGWLHNELVTFLSGKSYMKFAPQGNMTKLGEPLDRWTRPSCVVMSECNYSDAFMFPYAYKSLGIGKLIGMPVPGTGTAVWWETQIDPTLNFGIPMIGSIGSEGRPTENMQLEPDIRVPLPYADFLNGKDPQIEAAVKEMLKAIK